MARKAKYQGDGEYLQGIPARDLSDDEYAALTTEQKRAVRTARRSDGKPLYDVRSDAPARPAEEG